MSNSLDNGTLKSHLTKIEGSLSEIRDDLASAVKDLTRAVDNLTQRIDTIATMWEKSIPLRVVTFMFGILVLTMVGVEGAQWMFKAYLMVP